MALSSEEWESYVKALASGVTSAQAQLNAEATLAREERRHLETMAAAITTGVLMHKDGPNLSADNIAFAMREAISAAQIIRDEQARAGTEGKADA